MSGWARVGGHGGTARGARRQRRHGPWHKRRPAVTSVPPPAGHHSALSGEELLPSVATWPHESDHDSTLGRGVGLAAPLAGQRSERPQKNKAQKTSNAVRGASLGDAERRMPPRVTTTWKRKKRGERSGQEVKSGERERKSKRQPFKKYHERRQHRKSREEHLLLGGLIWYQNR